MANEKRLIDANALKEKLQEHHDFFVDGVGGFRYLTPKDKARVDEITHCIAEIVNAPTVDAVEVVHGRWERCGGDLHSSGYAVYCAVCNKTHFVHKEYSLGGLYGHKELFELPNYCPNCGAKMEDE